MRDWRREEALNQIRSRDRNERTRAANERPTADSSYMCECGDPSCRERIQLTAEEYERVRSDPTWFAVASNHENPEIDHVVAEHPGFATVTKVTSDFSRMALGETPRGI